MKYCKQCGAQVNSDGKFCAQCGSSDFVLKNKNKKVITIIVTALLILLIATIIAILIGNGVKDSTNKQNGLPVFGDVSTSENVESNTTETPKVLRKHLVAGNFSEGKIWITCKENMDNYVVCVDKNGKALFRYNQKDVTTYTEFSGGFAYITYKNVFSVIDTTGKILFSFPVDDYGEVKAYGDGYVMTEKYLSDFDDAYYLYTIYDSTGKKIKSFTLTDNGQIREANYCGEGVFGIQLRGSWNDPTEFYCIKSDKFVKVQGNIKCKFNNGKALVSIDCVDTTEFGYRAKMIFLTSNGETSFIPVYPEIGWDWDNECVFNGSSCIIYWPFSTGNVVNCVIESKKFYKLDKAYVEKINWDKIQDAPVYDSGVVALPLKGSDNKSYVMVFDEKMQKVSEPLVCNNFEAYKHGRMIVKYNNNTLVYNEKCELVFTLADLDAQEMTPYFEGVSVVDNVKCIDINGETVFEFKDIDYSDIITI